MATMMVITNPFLVVVDALTYDGIKGVLNECLFAEGEEEIWQLVVHLQRYDEIDVDLVAAMIDDPEGLGSGRVIFELDNFRLKNMATFVVLDRCEVGKNLHLF